jgi:hypothetical protein
MNKAVLFSIIESPMHPDFSALYRRCSIEEIRFDSMRKALAQLKKRPPDFIVAEFFYGYGNNYAGVNISNLDVLLYSLQKYAPQARVIVLVERSERVYVDKLNDIFPLHDILLQPLTETRMAACLDASVGGD